MSVVPLKVPFVLFSISEDEPGPLQSETEGKGGPKIGRRFSYLRNKMSKKVKVRNVYTQDVMQPLLLF